MAILEQRLVQRAQDEAAIIKARMNQAQDEISHWREFDYLIVNDDFTVAEQQLGSIVRAKRCETAIQAINHEDLLSKFQ